MQEIISQERLTMLLGGTLIGLGVRTGLSAWTRTMLFGVGGFLMLAGSVLSNSETPATDVVTEASEDSFPASDPPSWTQGVG